MRKFFSDEDGQAIVEYMLALIMAISIVAVIAATFRRSIIRVWETIAKEVSAACPGCPADPTVRIR